MEVSHFPTKGVTILHLPDPKPGVLPSPEQAAWSPGYRPSPWPPPPTGTSDHLLRASLSSHNPLLRKCVGATPRLQTQLQPLSLVAKTPASQCQLILVVSSSTHHRSSVLARWAVLQSAVSLSGHFAGATSSRVPLSLLHLHLDSIRP